MPRNFVAGFSFALERVAPDQTRVFADLTEAAFAQANAFGLGGEFDLVRGMR